MQLYKHQLAASFALVVGGFIFSHTSFAAGSTIQDAEQLRNKIIYHESSVPSLQNTTYKSIVLPVSKGFDQLETCLCWSYAFFNALETLDLVEHPNRTLEFSRGAMQYFNLQDRIDLKIAGAEDHLDPKKYKKCWPEGGTPQSAAYILKDQGALPFNDYHDVVSPPEYKELYYSIFAEGSTPEQQKAMSDSLLPVYFTYTPAKTTHFNGLEMSRVHFAEAVMPRGNWVTYGISKDGSEYTGNSLDPDARRGEQTHFIAKAAFVKKMNESLAKSRPILYSNDHHVILIYGADYNKNNKLISFYIKDSYESLGYYYKADVTKALEEIMEMTVLED